VAVVLVKRVTMQMVLLLVLVVTDLHLQLLVQQ
jgi:hypothetical protein